MAEENTPIPPRLADFEVLRRLGVGGMAEVFLAKKRGAEGTFKLLVVKRILPQFGSSRRFRTMFAEEAQLATRLLANRFIRQEELAGWSLVKTHAAVLPTTQKLQAFADDGTTQTAGQGKLNIFTLNELITLADQIGIGGRVVRDIYVSPRRYNDLRSQVTLQSLPFDMRSKLYGDGENAKSATPEIRIHKVYNPNLVTNNKAYAFTQKDGYFYGVMPIREKLFTRDNPIAILEWKIGIIGRMREGFGVLDDKGLVEITF